MPEELNNPSMQRRSDELFRQSQEQVWGQTDRLFARLMVLQWLAGIAMALWISPKTWLGARSEIHWHVWAALFLGGAITAMPVLLAWKHPGTALTRHVMAIAQMLTSALFIHLSGGRIETHFHVFGSLAFLAVYRDWRVLLTATVVTAADHILRGAFWPQSVYGVLSAGNWRWLEHAGWVVFEDTFLCVSIRQSLREMMDVASRRARLEGINSEIEQRVREQTAELSSALRNLQASEQRFRLLSASAPIGIFHTDGEGNCIYSSPYCQQISGYPAEASMGLGWQRMLHKHDTETVVESLRQARLNGTGFKGEVRIVNKSGEIRWCKLQTTLVRSDNGKVVDQVGTLEDITERKLAEDKIRLQTSALEATQNGIVITDKKGNILWVNPAFTRITGYSSEEAVGSNPRILKSGRHDKEFYREMWDTLRTGKAWRGEIINRRKDGSLYTEEMSINPVLDDQGRILNFVAIKQDISLRKQFEKNLADERDLLRALMDNLPDCVYFKDKNLRFIRVNKAQSKLLNLKRPEAAAGRTVLELQASQTSLQDLADESKILTTGEPVLDSRHQIRISPGKEMWVSSTKVPFRDPEGKIAGIVCVSRDITERVNAEASLAETSTLLQTLFDNVPEAIYFKDLQSRFVHFSKSFKQHFQVEDTVVLRGKKDFDFFIGEHARSAYDDEQNIIRTGKPIIGKLEKETHLDGTVSWCMTTKMPWRDKDGKIIGTFGISKDVTDLKQGEEERQKMQTQLQQAQKLEAIGQMAAGIAHEINTPTQYVIDNTSFLKESFESFLKLLKSHQELLEAAKAGAVTQELVASAEQQVAEADLDYLCRQVPAALKEAFEGLERVSSIVRATKEFSHPCGRDKITADINHAIESTATVARNEWKYVADMKLYLDPALPPVPCYLGELNQCILNLIVNAAHAIGDVVKQKPGTKGLITVQTRQDGEHVEIRVGDNGTGIPESARPRIFEPFFTTKEVGKGTGQGLAITYLTIVKKHGGTVRFETETGRGTTFILRLPLKPKEAEASPEIIETCEADKNAAGNPDLDIQWELKGAT
jgi:PAS domain S-box-containing protein